MDPNGQTAMLGKAVSRQVLIEASCDACVLQDVNGGRPPRLHVVTEGDEARWRNREGRDRRQVSEPPRMG